MIEALIRFTLVVLPMAMTTMVATFRQPFVSLLWHGETQGGPQVAFFIFGDSLVDVGNNDYLNTSSKANYWPYGETFFRYATGRACDGRIPPDFIAEYAGLPFSKPYLDPNFTDYTYGATFASAGAGVLHQTSPDLVSYLEEVTERLKHQKGHKDAQKLLSEAVYHLGMGGVDYVTLVKKSINSNTTLSPVDKEVFVSWVIGNLTTSIKKMYELGGRKFSLQNVAPLGYTPTMRYEMTIDGRWNHTDILARMHNEALKRLLPKLEKELVGFKYALFDYYSMLLERIFNYYDFGFEVGNWACCGSGEYNGEMTCGIKGDNFTLCPDPNEFVFFDPAHPTEKANRQLSSLMWSGESPVISPQNLKSLFSSYH